MKRVLLLALAAAAFMWVGALFDFSGKARPARDDGAEPASGPPLPPRAEAASRASSPSAGDKGEHEPLRLVGKLAERFVRPVNPPPPPSQAPPKEETQGELGTASRSPAYAKLERNYAAEPRNDEWASAQEHRIRGLLQSAALRKQVALVNCQDTVCRIVLDGVTHTAFDELLRVPGLREETKLDAQSPYSLRGGQLTLYFNPGAPTMFSTPP